MTLALIFVAALLFTGLWLRRTFRVFSWLYIPASVLAGGLGLLTVQIASLWATEADSRSLGIPAQIAASSQAITSELGGWPGWLIAVVFSTLLLERRVGKVRRGARGVFSEVIMVWVIVLGQTAIGLLLTWLFIQPLWPVPNSFGMLIETGFAGGHGTAAAMGEIFQSPVVGLESGRGLGLLVATVGLVYGVVSGILWINIGVRRGWVQGAAKGVREDAFHGAVKQPSANIGNDLGRQPKAIGFEVIPADLLDPILFQMIWIAFAFGIGLGLKKLVGTIAFSLDSWSSAATSAGTVATEVIRLETIVGSFPLFIYTLVGGWIVRRGLSFRGRDSWIDSQTLGRLSAIAMDILVVAAMTSLNLRAVYELFGPLLILLVGGGLWTALCLLVLARKILPRSHWFELGLINYGMSTGTTATGFVLLRIVDPGLETDAPEDYALATPFSAPFIGGGILTTGLPLLVLEQVSIGLSTILFLGIVVLLIAIGIFTQDRYPHSVAGSNA